MQKQTRLPFSLLFLHLLHLTPPRLRFQYMLSYLCVTLDSSLLSMQVLYLFTNNIYLYLQNYRLGTGNQ